MFLQWSLVAMIVTLFGNLTLSLKSLLSWEPYLYKILKFIVLFVYIFLNGPYQLLPSVTAFFLPQKLGRFHMYSWSRVCVCFLEWKLQITCTLKCPHHVLVRVACWQPYVVGCILQLPCGIVLVSIFGICTGYFLFLPRWGSWYCIVQSSYVLCQHLPHNSFVLLCCVCVMPFALQF